MRYNYSLYCITGLMLIVSGCNSSTDSEIPDDPPNVAAACVDGMAGQYPCQNIDLIAHLSADDLLGSRFNDIWGWTDPESGREFALIGLSDGVTFVEITEAEEPVVIGKLTESTAAAVTEQNYRTGLHWNMQLLHDDEEYKGASVWRDMKTYLNYMYVVAEEPDHGLQVFDLNRILDVDPDEMPVFFQEDVLYTEFGRAHNVAINEETGFLYVVGSLQGDTCASNGGLHMVDINNPLNPVFAGCHEDPAAGGVVRPGYVHDTQCVIYNGPDSRYHGKEVCFNSSELVLAIVDVTDKGNPETISIEAYDGVGYAHQGWLTEGQDYFIMNDELDELNNSHFTRTYVWDVNDLENPVMAGFHQFSTNAIDHNLYILGDYVYEANYLAGVRILRMVDLSQAEFEEVGFFDTTPGQSGNEFEGTWSLYPWLSDDKIIASDILGGLFILRFQRN